MGNMSKKFWNPVKSYFLISHGLPFVITSILMLLEKSIYITTPVFGTLVYLGLLSPVIGSLFVIYYHYDKEKRKKYWKELKTIILKIGAKKHKRF